MLVDVLPAHIGVVGRDLGVAPQVGGGEGNLDVFHGVPFQCVCVVDEVPKRTQIYHLSST